MTPAALLVAVLASTQVPPTTNPADLDVPAPVVTPVEPLQSPTAPPVAASVPSGSRFGGAPAAPAKAPPTAELSPPTSRFGSPAPPSPPRDSSAPTLPPSPSSVRLGGAKILASPPIVSPVQAATESSIPVTKQAEPPATGSVAEMLEGALASAESVDGKSQRIYDCLAVVAGRADRLKIVQAYWDLSAEDIRYRWAQADYQQVLQLSGRAAGADQVVLAALEARATANVSAAKLTVKAAQLDLVEVARLSHKDALPVPRNQFYVGKYGTNFDAIFAQRIAPAPLRRINGTLPLLRELMTSRANALDVSQRAFNLLTRGYAEAQVDLPAVLAGREQLRLAQEEFLSAVHHYNRDIAQFALGAAGGGISRGQVVGMLLPGKAPEEVVVPSGITPISMAPSGALQPASAIQLIPVPDAQAGPGVSEPVAEPMPSVLKQPEFVPATPPATFVPRR